MSRTVFRNAQVFDGREVAPAGTTVIVEHADGVRTRYAHLSAALVQKGETIAAGDVLGRAGQSGRATGPHVHFEVIANGVRVDPATLGLKPEGVVADLTVSENHAVPGD